MARKKGPAFKMKAAAHGGPMRKNFPAAFKDKALTEEELKAAQIAQAEAFGDIEIKAKGIEPGTFVQSQERGASIAGSSKEHADLRKKKNDPHYKMTNEERKRLRELNLLTQKAYWETR